MEQRKYPLSSHEGCWLIGLSFVAPQVPNVKKKNVKSFPSHKAHRAALISISLALSQTPVYTARPRIRG